MNIDSLHELDGAAQTDFWCFKCQDDRVRCPACGKSICINGTPMWSEDIKECGYAYVHHKIAHVRDFAHFAKLKAKRAFDGTRVEHVIIHNVFGTKRVVCMR